ncbi:beta/gamma crystallin-related protein [Brevundimonas faecalis]|uniref:Beta/gamma crystallin 'Greek key' domain-containing protein n=1 Tax=Brevundimonas faecalis TaxID=947378 RepID=A0ABV2RE15_9CAUL
MKQFVIAAAGLVMATGGVSFISAGSAEAQAVAYGAPRGSYAQTCSGSYVNRGRLYADCRDTRGAMRETSIELARCSSEEIHNDNGLLVCGRNRGDYEDSNRPGRPGRPDRPGGGWGGGNGGGWGGGSGSITVYRDADYRGQSQTFNSEIRNLRDYGMNDAISSVRLSRGSWELCEHADFRGRCEVVRGDIRTLRDLDFNDRVSSLRPAGRGGGRW